MGQVSHELLLLVAIQNPLRSRTPRRICAVAARLACGKWDIESPLTAPISIMAEYKKTCLTLNNMHA